MVVQACCALWEPESAFEIVGDRVIVYRILHRREAYR